MGLRAFPRMRHAVLSFAGVQVRGVRRNPERAMTSTPNREGGALELL